VQNKAKQNIAISENHLAMAFAEHFIPSGHQLMRSSGDPARYFIDGYRCKRTGYPSLPGGLRKMTLRSKWKLEEGA
jgi:hypothetical protein